MSAAEAGRGAKETLINQCFLSPSGGCAEPQSGIFPASPGAARAGKRFNQRFPKIILGKVVFFDILESVGTSVYLRTDSFSSMKIGVCRYIHVPTNRLIFIHENWSP